MVYIYIYIPYLITYFSMCVYIYIYIYTHTHRKILFIKFTFFVFQIMLIFNKEYFLIIILKYITNFEILRNIHYILKIRIYFFLKSIIKLIEEVTSYNKNMF